MKVPKRTTHDPTRTACLANPASARRPVKVAKERKTKSCMDPIHETCARGRCRVST